MDCRARPVHAALAQAYPPGFWDAFEALRSGNPAGLETAIDFLEADPLFFRSGYVKEDLIRLIARQHLTEKQAQRLRETVLDIVDRRDGREFRRYCRLARRLDNPALRNALDARRRSADANIRRRATWVLQALAIRLTRPERET